MPLHYRTNQCKRQENEKTNVLAPNQEMRYPINMEQNRFSYCPQCGTNEIETLGGGRKWKCPKCGFVLYNNVASAVGLVIENAEGEILFEKRAREPRKGFLVLPGGFTDPDETSEEAAYRECMEETGTAPEKLKYLCSFPNTYDYKGIRYKTCDIFFTASLPEGFSLKAQEGEVDAFIWKKIETKEDVETCPIAFDSAKNTLLKWLEEK